MAAPLVAYQHKEQKCTVPIVAQPPGIQPLTVAVTTGQPKAQNYTLRITRQVLIDEPLPSILRIDCPVGPST